MLAFTFLQTGPPGETGNKGPEGGRGQQGKEGKLGQPGPRGMQGDMGVPGLPGMQGAAVSWQFLVLISASIIRLYSSIPDSWDHRWYFRGSRRPILTSNKYAWESCRVSHLPTRTHQHLSCTHKQMKNEQPFMVSCHRAASPASSQSESSWVWHCWTARSTRTSWTSRLHRRKRFPWTHWVQRTSRPEGTTRAPGSQGTQRFVVQPHVECVIIYEICILLWLYPPFQRTSRFKIVLKVRCNIWRLIWRPGYLLVTVLFQRNLNKTVCGCGWLLIPIQKNGYSRYHLTGRKV